MNNSFFVEEILTGITEGIRKSPIVKESKTEKRNVHIIVDGNKREIEEIFKFIERLGVRYIEERLDVKTIEKTYMPKIVKSSVETLSPIEDQKKRVITEKDILELVGKRNKLHFSKGSIITPLAKDCAKENNITLIKD
ncbi:hypothetical protein IZY60_06165 [Lutibacter sp. B2]|nr:hypothetical protein [Lutibacter sp. B2]